MDKLLKFNNKLIKIGNSIVGKIEIPSITIGNQIWTSKNLAIDDGGEGITIIDNVTANGVNFGTQYYYTWDAAVRVANSITGWHLPTKDEWITLRNYAGGESVAGTKLKSTSGWNSGNGTDNYGFNVLPVGYCWLNDLKSLGSQDSFWTCTEDGAANAKYCYFVTSPYFIDSSLGKTNYNISVRLIKDS
jgi:uncharacterized protein (TIGR02145 family)